MGLRAALVSTLALLPLGGGAAEPEPFPAPAAADTPACPDGMTLVEGEYCPRVLQKPVSPGWRDPPWAVTGAAPGSRRANAWIRASRSVSAWTETRTPAKGRPCPQTSHPGRTRDASASPTASASVWRA